MNLVATTTVLLLAMAWCARAEKSAELVSKRTLARPVEIQGVPCVGRAFFRDTGTLSRCQLAHDDTLFGHAFPAGTVLQLGTDSTLEWCFLSRDTWLEGHLCKGSGSGGWQTAFHPNCRLRVAWLARDEEIQGVMCKHSGFWSDVFGGSSGTYFHDNGNLASCRLAQDATVDGIAFRRGTRIHFDRQGRVHHGDP